MSVRVATPGDLEAIMTIERASFAGDAWSSAAMAAELASPHNHYVVLEEAGRMLGYAGLRAAARARDADIQTIALSVDARGRGRGRALFETLLAEAERRGVHEVFLDVRADNPAAQGLYASEGFVEIARRPNYYPDGPTDAIVMRLDLRGWAARTAPRSEDRAEVGALRGDHPTAVGSSDADAAAKGAWCT